MALTHWGRVTHICVSKLTIIGSDNGLSPDRRQAIIWTNAGILLIGPLRTNFSEILIEILTFSFKKMRLKVSSAKRRPFCLGLNVLSGSYLWWLCVMVCLLLSQVGLLQLVICCGHLAGHVSSGIFFCAYYMPFIQRFHKILTLHHNIWVLHHFGPTVHEFFALKHSNERGASLPILFVKDQLW